MKNHTVRFWLCVLCWVIVILLAFLSSRRVDLRAGVTKSSGLSVRIEDVVSLGSPESTTQHYSMDTAAYQQISDLVRSASCYKKLNQNNASYAHDYEAHSVTLCYYNDADVTQLLVTVYSDGVCQANGSFVTLKPSTGTAESLYQQLREIAE